VLHFGDHFYLYRGAPEGEWNLLLPCNDATNTRVFISHSPENIRVSRLFSGTNYVASSSPARKLSLADFRRKVWIGVAKSSYH
jgi:hypothetical protein